jgi:hypothetical protein
MKSTPVQYRRKVCASGLWSLPCLWHSWRPSPNYLRANQLMFLFACWCFGVWYLPWPTPPSTSYAYLQANGGFWRKSLPAIHINIHCQTSLWLDKECHWHAGPPRFERRYCSWVKFGIHILRISLVLRLPVLFPQDLVQHCYCFECLNGRETSKICLMLHTGWSLVHTSWGPQWWLSPRMFGMLSCWLFCTPSCTCLTVSFSRPKTQAASLVWVNTKICCLQPLRNN